MAHFFGIQAQMSFNTSSIVKALPLAFTPTQSSTPTNPPIHTHLVEYVAPAQHHLGLGLHEGLVALVHVLEDVLSVVVEWILH